MIFQKLKKQQGFTFVEQVIVLAIIAFLSVTAMFTFSNVTIKQKHIAARDELIFNLRKIQNYAMTGRLIEDSVPIYYGIHIIDENNYKVFADINGDKLFDTSDVILDTVVVDSELTLSPNLGTYLAVVPNGSFCYHTAVNIPVELDCDSSRVQLIMIADTNVSHEIMIDPVLGDISYVE